MLKIFKIWINYWGGLNEVELFFIGKVKIKLLCNLGLNV